MNIAPKNQTVASAQGGSPSLRIFYSWQASVKANANRSFIEAALEKALDGIHKEFELANRPELDQDARGSSTFLKMELPYFHLQKFQEYVVAHELLPLRAKNHSKLFKATMSAHFPGWREVRF